LRQFFYAVQLSEVAAGPSSTARQRQAIADYLHAFAFFFSQEFILGTEPHPSFESHSHTLT
jgi:hypothetical protein